MLAWFEVHRGCGTKKRVRRFAQDEDYCVVLDPRGKGTYDRPKHYHLWTTFLCETDRQHAKMLKRHAKGEKKTEAVAKDDLATVFTTG